MLGTYEAGTDFTLNPTLNDQAGAAVDLKSGGDATVTAYVSRNGAIWEDAMSLTLNADADGNPPALTVADTVSNGWPAGKFTLYIKAELGGGAVRRWHDTFIITRGVDV